MMNFPCERSTSRSTSCYSQLELYHHSMTLQISHLRSLSFAGICSISNGHDTGLSVILASSRGNSRPGTVLSVTCSSMLASTITVSIMANPARNTAQISLCTTPITHKGLVTHEEKHGYASAVWLCQGTVVLTASTSSCHDITARRHLPGNIHHINNHQLLGQHMPSRY